MCTHTHTHTHIYIYIYIYIYIMLFVIRTINSNYYFPKNHELIVICNVDTMFSARLKLINFMSYI